MQAQTLQAEAQVDVEDTANALTKSGAVHNRIKTPVRGKMVRMGNVTSDVLATLQCAVVQYFVKYTCGFWSAAGEATTEKPSMRARCTPTTHRSAKGWGVIIPCNSTWAGVIRCRGACRVGSRVLS